LHHWGVCNFLIQRKIFYKQMGGVTGSAYGTGKRPLRASGTDLRVTKNPCLRGVLPNQDPRPETRDPRPETRESWFFLIKSPTPG
ncbi:MAG: hypothetical protein AAF680_05355, partial [Pseudomonadota bacterium]